MTETNHTVPDTASSEADLSKSHSGEDTREKDVEANAESVGPAGENSTPVAPGSEVQPNTSEKPAGPAGGPPPGPPGMGDIPDGGLKAWLQVAGGFMILFNTWGNLNTFGIFQTYYESGDLFKANSSDIAWIGAIQAALLLALGMISGPLYDRGYLRELLIFGSVFTVLGYMFTSLCHEFWQVVLAQGFMIGIGGGCLFVPAVSLLPTYFRKRLGLAVGLTASGSSLGGVIYPIIFYRLIDRIGFGWTVRVIGFIALGTLLIPCLLMKQRVKPPKARAIIDPTVFKEPTFLIFVAGLFFGFISLYAVLFFISYYGQATGILDDKLAFYIIPILNAASVFGRTIPNALSDHFGPLNIVGPGAILCSIIVFSLIAVHNTGGLIVAALAYGFASGVFIGMPPVCLAVLTKDKSKIGTRIGMAFGFMFFAALIGGPGSGALLGSNPADLNWVGLWAFSGSLAMAGGIIMVLLRFWMVDWKVLAKA